MPFGRALRTLREAANLTQEELGARSGMARSAIAKLEGEPNKQPRWETILRLSQALGVPLDSFATAAAQYVEPPIDRLQALETLAEDLRARVAGLEDRQLESALLIKQNRAELSQLRNDLASSRKRGRPT